MGKPAAQDWNYAAIKVSRQIRSSIAPYPHDQLPEYEKHRYALLMIAKIRAEAKRRAERKAG